MGDVRPQVPHRRTTQTGILAQLPVMQPLPQVILEQDPPVLRWFAVPLPEMLPSAYPLNCAGRPGTAHVPARHALPYGTPGRTACRPSCREQAGSDT